MRPRRLELAGFASFREPAEIDFSDADLFVLTGPTGSGKSSVIDAITFALYGSVARYDNPRLVAPVITQGQLEARVRLDFSIGGEDYTAVRVVRRTPTGATTREARLERGGETLAGNAEELTREVERRLGLGFEHFTRCVVLPQGEFARFLHDRPKSRQDLLIELLELDLYRQMRGAAAAREQALAGRSVWLLQRLTSELADTDRRAVAAAKRTERALEKLLARVDRARPRLAELAERAEQARVAARGAGDDARLLDTLAIPAAAADLARRVQAAAEAEEAGRGHLAEALARLERAEAARAGLPAPAPLERLRERHAERRRLTGERDELAARLAAARQRRVTAGERVEAARAEVAGAEARRDEARRRHAAAELAQGLTTGDDCPVCARPLTEPPALSAPPDLERAGAAVTAAGERLRRAEEAAAEAGRQESRLEADLDGRGRRLAELDGELEGQPAPAALEELVGRIDRAEADLAAARQGHREASSALETAGRTLAEVRRQASSAWGEFDRVRDRLARLAPPPAERADLGEAWRALLAWAAAVAPRQRAAAEQAEARAATLAAEAGELAAALAGAAGELGVDAGTGELRDACWEALTAARATRQRLERDLEEAARLRLEAREVARQAKVARELARLLGASYFERWYLSQALARLAAGASALLHQLTGGAYSLALDDKATFVVVDHNNADERRPARTLSGGETFLASLALALALADEVAQLAARGAPKLEAIFLDEGFGTLDLETLETVTAAVEEIGARGRMVGLVTHVPELAERIPVRYEVRKDARTSTVTRRAG